MKLRFRIKNQTDGRTNERTNGDIEALADARRALKKPTFITNIELYGQESRKTSFVRFYY